MSNRPEQIKQLAETASLQTMQANGAVDIETARRESQLTFDASDENILIGNLEDVGLDLQQLQQTDSDSHYVLESFTDGLTAEVFHIRFIGQDWNLKIKRPESLVKNIDGQTSFLNEVQRRRDFTELKVNAEIAGDSEASEALNRIVDTKYASYRDGVMLSPWATGERLDEFNELILEQIFSTTVQLELNGFMEWDLCPGNIIYDGQNIALFDFGYCYPFNPLEHFNSCGLSAPMFHSVERLETRNFFGYLLNREDSWSDSAIFSLYELEKRLAIEAYKFKQSELIRRGASAVVVDWLEDILKRWQIALGQRAELEKLFVIECYRSHVLDIHDDLMGQSCTPMTLRRIDKVEAILKEHYAMLLVNNGLFFGDEKASKSALLAKLTSHREKAEQYQL